MTEKAQIWLTERIPSIFVALCVIQSMIVLVCSAINRDSNFNSRQALTHSDPLCVPLLNCCNIIPEAINTQQSKTKRSLQTLGHFNFILHVHGPSGSSLFIGKFHHVFIVWGTKKPKIFLIEVPCCFYDQADLDHICIIIQGIFRAIFIHIFLTLPFEW